jgi:hypothetical protein
MFLLLLFLWIEKKLTNKVSPIVTITYQDYSFVQLQNLDEFAINLEESLWNNMLDKNFPNTKISQTSYFFGHHLKLSTSTRLLAMFLATFTIVL